MHLAFTLHFCDMRVHAREAFRCLHSLSRFLSLLSSSLSKHLISLTTPESIMLPETSSGISDRGGDSATWISKHGQTLKQLRVTMSALSMSAILPCCFRSRSKIQYPAATMENLPDEILLNIFIRVLAKQIGQMRCVSKSWNLLLSHPFFVKSHLHHSIHNNNHQLLLVFPGSFKPFKEYSCKSPNLEPTNFIKHTPADLPMGVIGSVRGLICLHGLYYSNIHIWNPSLSAVSAIPPPHSMASPHYNETSIRFRFGFDPKTNDYKLVKLSDSRSCISVQKFLQVEIYSLRKGSWKTITRPSPFGIRRISDTDTNHLFVDGHDGHLHWFEKMVPKTKTIRNILSFDLGSETFLEMRLPHSIQDSKHRMQRLGVLGGKLCEMSWRKGGAWEVWVMEEYGVSKSWVKRHVFSQFNYKVRLYGFTSRNELLLKDKDGRLVLYDSISNKTKLGPTKSNASTVVQYVDSLVWV